MKTKPRLLLGFDIRNSFIENRGARIYSWKIGVEFNERFRIGGGFSHLVSNHHPSLDRVIFKANGKDTLATAKLRFNYITYFIDYVFYKRRKWEFSVPIQVGIGLSQYDYRDEDGTRHTIGQSGILLYEPAIFGTYKITKWFGLGMGAGFRIMLINNKGISSRFNSPIYIFKVKIFFGEIYRSVFRKKDEE